MRARFLPPLTDEELIGISYSKAAESPIDPTYNSDVREQSASVQAISDEITSVNILGPGQIELRMARNRSLTRETAQKIGRLFEAPVINQQDYQPGNSGEVSFAQPMAHSYYKTDARRRH